MVLREDVPIVKKRKKTDTDFDRALKDNLI